MNGYKAAAESALEDAWIMTIFSQTKFSLTFGYGQTSEVERILGDFAIDYLEKNYTSDCEFIGLIKDEEVTRLEKKLELVAGADLGFPETES